MDFLYYKFFEFTPVTQSQQRLKVFFKLETSRRKAHIGLKSVNKMNLVYLK